MPKSPDHADYIIIGAGSAGCTLAGRLSEDADSRVMVLEAGGGDWNPLIRIPIGTGKLIRSKFHSWGYATEPQSHLDGRAIHWPRGKVIGGSSSVNSMVYMRGNRADYDHWRQLGCAGWAYADVLPYFKKAEGSYRGADDFHDGSGPLKVGSPNSDNSLYDAFIRAGEQAGHATTADFNGAQQEGFGRFDYTIHRGRRCSAAVAYLKPALRRANCELRTRAHITRVLIENHGAGPKAVGVEYVRRGTTHQVFAEREVLLCGGSINSPQVLLLSGIGAPANLRPHGIQMTHELAGVGENLQDHLDVPLQYACTQPITLHSMIRLDRIAPQFLRAIIFRTGPCTSFPAEGGAFLRTDPALAVPDIQVHFLTGLTAARVRIPWLWRRNRGPLERDGFTTRICQLRPQSRGTIRLRSADPFEKALMEPNYLASEVDRQTLRKGLRMLREVVRQPAFDPFRGEELGPGPDSSSDDELDAWINTAAESIYHPVGSCKMGPDTDPTAVVDLDLKVRGIAGLRVVDASVMPTVIGGNTNAPTIAIAEKAADSIRGRKPRDPWLPASLRAE